MQKIMLKKLNRLIQNMAILLMVLAGAANIVLAMPHSPRLLADLGIYYGRISHHTVILHRSLTTIIGFILIFVSYNLYRRLKTAWFIAAIGLCVAAITEIFRFHTILNPMSIVQFLILGVLVVNQKDFVRQSNRLTFRLAFILAGISIFIVLLNTAVTIFLFRENFENIKSFGHAFMMSINLLFLLDNSPVSAFSNAGQVYTRSAVIINWSAILFGLLLILRPLVFRPIRNRLDLDRVRKLVNQYGQSPISYLALESDKTYFFGEQVDGVIAYQVAAGVAVCCGDMICPADSAMIFLSEFMVFCKRNGLSITFINVMDQSLPLFKSAGFGWIKYGEDAMFRLSDYNLAGGKVAKVRAAINHANKAGITVEEYRPLAARNLHLEKEIQEITRQWLTTKKSQEMAFMLGGTGLDNPMDRRYFVARNPAGQMLGFVVFLPFDQGRGYMADVTRRLPDAEQGVLEKIIYDAFMIMKAEGAVWGSMGLAPLVNIRDEDHTLVVGRLFEFIYENLNNLYGFKSLYHAKSKYAPTDWMPRYLVYYPEIFNARIAYSIVKVQNPKGISDYLLAILKKQTEDAPQSSS